MPTYAPPPGWPREVRPPDAPDWEITAAKWLLDLCPAEYRRYPGLRRHVVVLARFAVLHVEAQQAACRRGLSQIRADLKGVATLEVVEAAVQTFQLDESRLMATRRSVGLVEDALRVGATSRVCDSSLASVESMKSENSFAGVVLVDVRGWILLQERDEHPRIDPEKWGLAGGHLDPGEDFETGAYRELEEETGVTLVPGALELFGEFTVDHRHAYGTWDRMQVFVAATDLTDADIECNEGRQIVFVDPAEALALDLSAAAAIILPAFLASPRYQHLAGARP